MSVVSSNRGESSMQFIQTARELQIYMTICLKREERRQKMYQIKKQTETIKVDHIVFVKKQDNGLIVSCPENEAQGIVQESGDGFYNLQGKEPMGEFETVSARRLTITDEIHDALIYKTVDDDFRLTMIEMSLGIE